MKSLCSAFIAAATAVVSLNAHAAILSVDSSFGVDTITRDTESGLDWLDLTVTLGLSYNQVSAQMGAGGLYEGWRYATMAELDQLIINFGYVAETQPCNYTSLHCDLPVSNDSQGELIETMIRTLGDTLDPFLDANNDFQDVAVGGTGYAVGILGTSNRIASRFDFASIYDHELISRGNPQFLNDAIDVVNTSDGTIQANSSFSTAGSFLVASSPSPVPVPAAVWFFGAAIGGLFGLRHKRRRALAHDS